MRFVGGTHTQTDTHIHTHPQTSLLNFKSFYILTDFEKTICYHFKDHTFTRLMYCTEANFLIRFKMATELYKVQSTRQLQALNFKGHAATGEIYPQFNNH